jgi:hypothetical protein
MSNHKNADALEGKTPWQFACEWYTVNEIAHSIACSRKGLAGHNRVPPDIYSVAFAEFLTEQYRLAMRKGIEIGQRSIADRLESAEQVMGKLAEAVKQATPRFIELRRYREAREGIVWAEDFHLATESLNAALAAHEAYRKETQGESTT